MDLHLVVVRPFGGLARGDAVTEPARIAAILDSEHAASVVRVVASARGTQIVSSPRDVTPAAQEG